MGIFSPCVFYLDPNARLSTLSLADEAKSQDFADSETHALTLKLQDAGGTVLSGTCGRSCAAVKAPRECAAAGPADGPSKKRFGESVSPLGETEARTPSATAPNSPGLGIEAQRLTKHRDRACGRRVRRKSVHALRHGQRGRRLHRRRGYQQAPHREQVPFPSGVAGLDPSLPPVPLVVFPTKPLACVCSRSHPLSPPSTFFF